MTWIDDHVIDDNDSFDDGGGGREAMEYDITASLEGPTSANRSKHPHAQDGDFAHKNKGNLPIWAPEKWLFQSQLFGWLEQMEREHGPLRNHSGMYLRLHLACNDGAGKFPGLDVPTIGRFWPRQLAERAYKILQRDSGNVVFWIDERTVRDLNRVGVDAQDEIDRAAGIFSRNPQLLALLLEGTASAWNAPILVDHEKDLHMVDGSGAMRWAEMRLRCLTDSEKEQAEASEILNSFVEDPAAWDTPHHVRDDQAFFAINHLEPLLAPAVAVVRAENDWLRSGDDAAGDRADDAFGALTAAAIAASETTKARFAAHNIEY